jgi:hypothetical protein
MTPSTRPEDSNVRYTSVSMQAQSASIPQSISCSMTDEVPLWWPSFADSDAIDGAFDTVSLEGPLGAIGLLGVDAPAVQAQSGSFISNRPLVQRSVIDPALIVENWDNSLTDQHNTSLSAFLTVNYSHISPTPVPARHANSSSNPLTGNIAGEQTNHETRNYPTQ